MRAPQYQVVAVKGLIETEEQYQVSALLVLLLRYRFLSLAYNNRVFTYNVLYVIEFPVSRRVKFYDPIESRPTVDVL